MRKLAMIAAVVGVAAVGTAQAKGPPPQHPADSHKCVPHKVAYVASGKLVSSSLTKNADGTYSGTLKVHVTHTNHHARADKGTDREYTLDHAKVHFGHGVDPAAPAAGDRVHLSGKITELARKCDQTGFKPTVTIHKVGIKTPTHSHHS
jgi:hypothetical protein